ncbi:MAG: hypothetical protein J7L69_09750, partial [Desulfobulbaceae bacterium]|nr:hypothetical protein [Desulfobulbaceae bacterium]
MAGVNNFTESDQGTKPMPVPVDKDQRHQYSASGQKTADKKKIIPFDPISLAKLSTKILLPILALIFTTLAFLLYLNDQEAREKL